MLVECFYALEDFTALGRLMEALPDGSALLHTVGEKFQSVGLCNEGVAAFLKVRGYGMNLQGVPFLPPPLWSHSIL